MYRNFLIIFLLLSVSAMAQQSPRILVFSKTNGYHHASIPDGIAALQRLGAANGFTVDTTTNTAMFNNDTLKQYAALVFLSPSGDLFNNQEKAAFQTFIRSGKGFAGIHAASTPEKQWPWYGQLVGAVFNGHPEQAPGVVVVADTQHEATRHLPARWPWTDEWYNFKNITTDLHVLLKADETTYKGGTNGPDHPLAWYHSFEGGRSFYTALGHRPEAYTNPLFLKHILAGIQYAIGTTH